MQQYLYKIQRVRPRMLSEGPTEQESRVVSDHYSYLKELMEQGAVILAGRTQNTDYSSFGIVIFKAESLEQARRIVENDPGERRRGIGRKLTEKAESALKARGSQITAALVETDNSPSLLLFEKCGYTAHKDILYLTKRDSGQV